MRKYESQHATDSDIHTHTQSQSTLLLFELFKSSAELLLSREITSIKCGAVDILLQVSSKFWLA